MLLNVLPAKLRRKKIVFKSYLKWFSISIFAFATDQVSKIAVRNNFQIGESKKIFEPFLRFTYVENRNAIFGLNLPVEYFFFPAAIISLIFIIYYVRKVPDRILSIVSMGMITGGALGNVIDRILYSSVTDFIDMGINSNIRWYIYNISDAWILIGIVLLFIEEYLIKPHPTKNN